MTKAKAVPAVYVIVTVNEKNKTAYGPYKGGSYEGRKDATNHLCERGWFGPVARSDITRFVFKDRKNILADLHFGFVTKIKVKPRSRLPDMRKKK